MQLHLWPGAEGTFHWYEDDGLTREHEAGLFHRRSITLRRQGRTSRLDFGPSEGGFTSRVRDWRIIVWDTPPSARVRIDGIPHRAADSGDSGLLVIDLPNQPGAMKLAIVGGA
jgi:hypothetical protein